MLKKGYLIHKTSECTDEDLKKNVEESIALLSFPHLMVDEISAYFVKNDGEVTSMINESENGAFLYEKMIEDITQSIDNDYMSVKKILRQFKG
jgi:hypothetical protein